MRLAKLLIASVMAAAVCTACDKERAPAPPAEPATPPASAPRPATQTLLEGPRKTLTLASLPLTLRVPEPWKIQPLGRVTFLEGPAPAGDVQIQLSQRPNVTEEQLKILVSGARKEMAERPEAIKKIDLRQLGGMQILERQEVGAPLPPRDEQGHAISDTSPSMRWTVTAYVPGSKGYSAYELNFVGLTTRQYEADRDFLQMILDSMNYVAQPSTNNR